MTLYFRVDDRKRAEPLINVLRTITGKTGKPTQEGLGSFRLSDDKACLQPIIDKLTDAERYEFDNFVSVVAFSAQQLHANASALDARFNIRSLPAFQEALHAIWETAKAYGIDFVPEHEMLTALLNKAKVIEQHLQLLTNGQFSALTRLNIPITTPVPYANDEQVVRLLFQAVVKYAASTEQLAEEFNQLAKKQHKSTLFKPHYFPFLADSDNRTKQMKPWYPSLAIDWLSSKKIDPLQFISSAALTDYWLRLHKGETLEGTMTAFVQQFPALKDDTHCRNIIYRSFVNAALMDMGHFQQWNDHPSPSVAIEKWLRYWKKNNKGKTAKQALIDFTAAYPLLANNSFCIEVIKRCIK